MLADKDRIFRNIYGFHDSGLKGAISRVVQRLDGYVSANAAYTGGELTTVPIVFSGTRLELNVDAGVAGSAQVEILGGDGAPVSGFALADADVIKGNHIARICHFK